LVNVRISVKPAPGMPQLVLDVFVKEEFNEVVPLESIIKLSGSVFWLPVIVKTTCVIFSLSAPIVKLTKLVVEIVERALSILPVTLVKLAFNALAKFKDKTNTGANTGIKNTLFFK
jgi:hypothetical protein